MGQPCPSPYIPDLGLLSEAKETGWSQARFLVLDSTPSFIQRMISSLVHIL